MTKQKVHSPSETGQLLLQRVAAIRSNLVTLHKRQSGVTLIELCVVMFIMGVLLLPVTNWTLDVLVAPAKAMLSGNEQTNTTSISEAIDGPLKATTIANVGERELDGSINPASIAGDQIIFTTTSGKCYRFFYVQYPGSGGTNGQDQLREAESDSGCDAIRAERGPNQSGDTHCDDTSNPLYDPVLCDIDNKSWIVASYVWTDGNGGDDLSTPLFTFFNNAHQAYPVDAEADSETTNSWYSDADLSTTVGAVKVELWAGSPGTGSMAVDPMHFTQTITPEQG